MHASPTACCLRWASTCDMLCVHVCVRTCVYFFCFSVFGMRKKSVFVFFACGCVCVGKRLEKKSVCVCVCLSVCMRVCRGWCAATKKCSGSTRCFRGQVPIEVGLHRPAEGKCMHPLCVVMCVASAVRRKTNLNPTPCALDRVGVSVGTVPLEVAV